ncbi:MAG: hypothetical protein NTW32_20655, partial [Chloroflexi bacterium]|nr:hypothetical protein [Chloroflexota bacterium]
MDTFKFWLTIISGLLSIILLILQIVKAYKDINLPGWLMDFISKPFASLGQTILFSLISISVISGFLSYNNQTPTKNGNLILGLYKGYDFESAKNSLDTKPFIPIPLTKKYKAVISSEAAFAHTGSNSFQLIVDTKAYQTDPANEYAGVAIINNN